MAYMDGLPEALRRLVGRQGSQSRVAERAGIKKAQVSEYLSGKTAPSVGNLGKMLDALDATLVDLWDAMLVADDELRERFGSRVRRQDLDDVDLAALDLAQVLREAAQVIRKPKKRDE